MFHLMRKLKTMWGWRVAEPQDFTEEQLGDDWAIFSIGFSERWRLELPRDLGAFVRALPDLFPSDTVLRIRAGRRPSSVDGLVDAWLAANPDTPSRDDCEAEPARLETPVTPENMERVAAMASSVRPEDVRFLSVVRVESESSENILLDWKQTGLILGDEVDKRHAKALSAKLSIAFLDVERVSSPRPRWNLDSVLDVPAFLRAALPLVGPGATISLFGGDFPSLLHELEGICLVPYEECDEFSHLHIPLTENNVGALEAALESRDVAWEFISFFIVREGATLFQCGRYSGTSVYMDIPKARIDTFCRELGMKRLGWWRSMRCC